MSGKIRNTFKGKYKELGVVTHACNASTQGAEAGGAWMSSRPASVTNYDSVSKKKGSTN